MAIVGWYPSDGALKYVVTAISASGHTVTCEAITTNCDLERLLCGQSYSISVKAVGQTCSSIANMTGQLVTGEEQLNTAAFMRKQSASTQYFVHAYCHGTWMCDRHCAE